MEKNIITFRRQLREDIIKVLYNHFFEQSQEPLKESEIYDKLDKIHSTGYNVRCPKGFLYTYELNSALTYLTEIGYIKSHHTGLITRLYRISVKGIDHYELIEQEKQASEILTKFYIDFAEGIEESLKGKRKS